MLEPCLIRAHISHIERTVGALVTAFSDSGIRASVEEALPLDGSVAVTLRRPSDGSRVQVLGKVIRVDTEGVWKGHPAVEIAFRGSLTDATLSDTGQFKRFPKEALEEPPAEATPAFGSETMAFFAADLADEEPEPKGFGSETMAFFGDDAGGKSALDAIASATPPGADSLPGLADIVDSGAPPLPPDLKAEPASGPVIERGRESGAVSAAKDIDTGGLELGTAPTPAAAAPISVAGASASITLPIKVSFRVAGREQMGLIHEPDPYGFFIETIAGVRREAIVEVDLPLGKDGRSHHRCTATIRWLASEQGKAPPEGFYAEIMSFKNAKGRGEYEAFLRAVKK